MLEKSVDSPPVELEEEEDPELKKGTDLQASIKLGLL